ncbi:MULTISPECIES: rRNA maturation RNase YbeY [unclassified Parvimonas]|uniref:rRNA maturation RNase YbeY n=1 Tax=unclassified Parvimonas TaxID=1151464 RepID=UPI002B47104D|nr:MULTISPECIES: rRNA maturation RNase YbeY [unclassified Parvimonas]MEB3024641.1 rRNA maturation RNase YbeY [Parvimonas sp. M13]MEB3072187.1 rRNA maturation RNase YbeY [Parvimonas sp. C2]MEB3088786.1 rRNA maturation RNase YbeY [Parvimonas sp. M20]
MNVLFDNRQDSFVVSENLKAKIVECIKTALRVENREISNVEVSVSFVTNEEIKNINSEFRNINKETDVLSFPMDFEFSEEGMPYILGDIIISTEKSMEQAKEFGHSIDREILYLVCHSVFHLLGYDHIEESDKLVMRNKEKETMKLMEVFKNEKEF